MSDPNPTPIPELSEPGSRCCCSLDRPPHTATPLSHPSADGERKCGENRFFSSDGSQLLLSRHQALWLGLGRGLVPALRRMGGGIAERENYEKTLGSRNSAIWFGREGRRGEAGSSGAVQVSDRSVSPQERSCVQELTGVVIRIKDETGEVTQLLANLPPLTSFVAGFQSPPPATRNELSTPV